MALPGDVEIANTISIKNSAPAPIIRINEVLGGIHTVADVTARDAIPSYLRQEGLVAYVQSGPSMFQLVGGITNADWAAFGGGASSLQAAYDGGATITQTLLSGPTTIDNPAATAQATLVLTQATAGSRVLDAAGGDIALSGGNYVVATGQRVEGTAELTLASLGAGGVVVDAVGAGTDIDFRRGGVSTWVIDGTTGAFLAGAAGQDIGSAVVAERPDRVYVATEVVVGSTITINGVANTISSSGNLSTDTAAAGTLNLGATNAAVVNLGSASATLNALGDVVVASGRRIDSPAAGTLSIGTVDAATVDIGSATSTVQIGNDLTVQGDLTVNGTTTTINSTSLAVTDRFILCANGSSNLSGGLAVSQANGAGNDLIFMWNDTAGRAEVGFGDSSTNPAGVSSFSDAKVQNLELAGTSVTADGALAVVATGAQLTLAALGANPIAFQTAGNDRFSVAADGGTVWIGLAADPSLSAAAQAKVVYNSSTNTLRASLNGAAYEDIALASALTLQEAYDNGPSIATSTANGSVALSGSDANNDAVLTVAKNPAGAQSGNGISVTMGANTTSPGLAMTTSGTGGGISVTVLGSGLAGFFSGGSVSCPVAGFANNERFGQGANSAAISASAFGNAANAQFSNSVAIGAVATTTATGGIAIGANSSATGVAIGSSASAAASGSVAIGTNSVVGGGFTGSIAIGVAVVPTAANQFVAGSSSASITSVYFGNGAENAAPVDYTIFGTTATGVNVNGGSVTVQAGSGNGTGFGGSLNLNGGTPGVDGIGGDLNLTAGPGGTNSGAGGSVSLNAGSPTDGDGGSVSISAESGIGTARTGGSVSIVAGDSTDAVQGGSAEFLAGSGGDTGTGGQARVAAGTGGSTSGPGGDLILDAGEGGVAASSGGSVFVRTAAPGTGTTLQNRIEVTPAGLVGVGQTPTSTLHVGGSLALRTSSISANATAAVDVAIYLVDATLGAVTLTLPPAASCADRVYQVKKTDSSVNGVVIDGDGAETIDGLASQTLAVQYEAIAVVSDGTQWWIL